MIHTSHTLAPVNINERHVTIVLVEHLNVDIDQCEVGQQVHNGAQLDQDGLAGGCVAAGLELYGGRAHKA